MPEADHAEPIVALTDAPTAERSMRSGPDWLASTSSRAGSGIAAVGGDRPRSRDKQPVGGLTGRTSLGLLFIDLFFLPETCVAVGSAVACCG